MTAMSNRAKWARSAALVAVLAGGALMWPASGQESLLPEGFGEPVEPARPRPAPPAPSGPATAPAQSAPARPAPARPGPDGFVTETAPGAALAPAPAADATPAEAAAAAVRVDLPPGTRRSLDRIGPLVPETGGLGPEALGTAGRYAAAIMRASTRPVAARWGNIMLRRALLSAADTPADIHGADLTAARAAMLLAQGEAQAAGMLIQAVDADRATPGFAETAMAVALANADPAGMCPHVTTGLGRSDDQQRWRLAAGMCAALRGEPGPAGWAVDRARRSGKVPGIDVFLAEKVLGAAASGRRSITIQWDGVDRLTPWRLGLAAATATPMPAPLRAAMPAHYHGWLVAAPMLPMAERLAAAGPAAAQGVLSSAAYVSLVAEAAAADEVAGGAAGVADTLAEAFAGPSSAARLAAMQALWNQAGGANGGDGGPGGAAGYAALVLTARAAAALPISTDVGDDLPRLLGSMLAGGYDRSAMAWVPTVAVGSPGWGILAVASPGPLRGVDAAALASFAGDDDSADRVRSKLLLAGLAGLGRISAAEASAAAQALAVSLDRPSRWSRAIDGAAARGEAGLVVLLVAAGMQGDDLSRLPPHHLFKMVAALRRVGLGPEARMLAAEAVVRS